MREKWGQNKINNRLREKKKNFRKKNILFFTNFSPSAVVLFWPRALADSRKRYEKSFKMLFLFFFKCQEECVCVCEKHYDVTTYGGCTKNSEQRRRRMLFQLTHTLTMMTNIKWNQERERERGAYSRFQSMPGSRLNIAGQQTNKIKIKQKERGAHRLVFVPSSPATTIISTIQLRKRALLLG